MCNTRRAIKEEEIAEGEDETTTLRN